jgi:putative DNA primase/helicase
MGSIGIIGAARSEVLLGSNPKNTAELAMIHTKSNCAPYGQSLGFKIEKGVLIPTGPTALTADDLMALNLSGSEERSALEEAVEFLIESLRYGKVPAKKIQREANEVGISERTLKRAKKEIKVECNKVGDQWFWSIPSGPKNEEGQLSHVAPLAPFPVLAPLNGSDDENQGIFNMGTV